MKGRRVRSLGKKKRVKKEPNGELDQFSRLMFGANKRREGNKKDESSSQEIYDRKIMFGTQQYREGHKKNERTSQEVRDENEAPHSNRRTNQFDNWFFASGRNEEEYSTPTPQNQLEQQIGNLLNNVDLGLLMETVDMLVETTKQYKPLLKEITPMFNQFIKKFKSK